MSRRTIHRILFGVLCAACLMLCHAAHAQAARGDLSARFADVPTIEKDGITYRLNPRMTGLLIIGVDNEGFQETQNIRYREGGQADFLLLLAIDDDKKSVTPIQINRDTLAEITVLSLLGQETGTTRAQIALSHAFGDGGERSCELVSQAVSGLLLGVPIGEYLSMQMDGIAVMNDLIGGVTVTLKDDFSVYDSQMTSGTTLRLQGKQAEYFLRQRYHIGDQTNLSRQMRHIEYIDAAKPVLGEKLKNDQNYAMTLYEGLEPYLVTSMSRGKLINLANKIASYTVLPVEEIGGSLFVDEDGFIALEPDAQEILNAVLRAFYYPLS